MKFLLDMSMVSTPLAWKNLTHQPVRTTISVLGIGFAILLMYMQLGFLGAVGDAATNIYGRLNWCCDLVRSLAGVSSRL